MPQRRDSARITKKTFDTICSHMASDVPPAADLDWLTEQEALAESLRAIYRGQPERIGATVLAALFASWYADERLLLVWCVLAVAVVPLQSAAAARLLRRIEGLVDAERRAPQAGLAGVRKHLTAIAGITGLVWGALPLIAPANTSTGWILHAMSLLLALSAGSTLISLHPRPLLAFQAPLAVVGAATLATRGGRPSMSAAVLLLAALASQYAIGRAVGAKARDRIRLHLRSDQLATQLSEANAALLHQARHDALTGLPNRRASLEHLARAVPAQATGGAVALLDVDRFKLVNDSYGHSAGDAVLRQLATRLPQVLAEADFVSREGGDEFLLSIATVRDSAEAEAVAERVMGAFDAPFLVDGRELMLSGSLGLVIIADEPDASVEDLIRFADVAMYEAKSLGRSQSYVYDQALSERSQQHLKMADELRQAIVERSLELWMQPIHDLRDGRMVGVEGLARWMRNDGVRSAGTFFDTADRAGLSRDIDALMIEQAARLLDRTDWEPGFRIALNVPPRYAPWFLSRALEQIEQRHLRHVIFELTETDLTIDVPLIRSAIEQVRSAGAQVVLDDLGTGHSSLSLVQELPLDGIKIDQQFVQAAGTGDETAPVAVRAAVALGRQMNLTVTAEGVETEQQRALMQELGVDYAQGWFYARAQPPETLFPFPSEP